MTDQGQLKRPIVLVGISGGIAAYKAVDVVSRLRKEKFEVHVAMTEAAQQFVTPLTFGAVSGHPVQTQIFPAAAEDAEALYPHLYPATRADFFLLMPATADMISHIAQGLGRDIVSTSALSLSANCRRVFCPAMNVEMWNQPIVQKNTKTLEETGWHRIGPNSGMLACGMEGEGRMAEPEEIVRHVLQLRDQQNKFKGKRLLIISGPTREHIDPVRFIGNPSTGKMGKALAEEALAAGADVDFVTGPVADNHLPRGNHLHIHRVINADDMLAAAQAKYAAADVVIYAAAVADYKPIEFQDKKMPKKEGELTIRLTSTPDVAATLNQAKRTGQVTIGFALQTHDGEDKARAKLKKKNLDGIVLNSLDALGGESGNYSYLSAHNGQGFHEWGKLSKRDCARHILDEAIRISASTINH